MKRPNRVVPESITLGQAAAETLTSKPHLLRLFRRGQFVDLIQVSRTHWLVPLEPFREWLRKSTRTQASLDTRPTSYFELDPLEPKANSPSASKADS